MFTGIIEGQGEISVISKIGHDMRLHINTLDLQMGDVKMGDSIAVSGVCLTVVEYDDHSFVADVSEETIKCTALSQLSVGYRVNLEKAMLLGGRFGGHIVSGHVDGVGQCIDKMPESRSMLIRFSVPVALTKFISVKGSITLNGVSLTVNTIANDEFSVNIVPHTLEKTTLHQIKVGDIINVEVDIIARYLDRLVNGDAVLKQGLTLDKLKQNGFA